MVYAICNVSFFSGRGIYLYSLVNLVFTVIIMVTTIEVNENLFGSIHIDVFLHVDDRDISSRSGIEREKS